MSKKGIKIKKGIIMEISFTTWNEQIKALEMKINKLANTSPKEQHISPSELGDI